eukprot:11990.XXX_492883_492396_1 [CDS] Oithona nana genome sequencing.
MMHKTFVIMSTRLTKKTMTRHSHTRISSPKKSRFVMIADRVTS